MNPSIYIVIFFSILIVLILENQNEKMIITRMVKSKRKKENSHMKELAKQFIGKECIIYVFNSQLIGTITEVGDGAILVQSKNSVEAINLDFIVRISEYPRNKNGKKKLVLTN